MLLCWCGHPSERHPPIHKTYYPWRIPEAIWDDFFDFANPQHYTETKCLHCSCKDFAEREPDDLTRRANALRSD
jgi:hypothetical protein